MNATTGHGSNDQHPDHDVALGEALMKDIYEALRNSPQVRHGDDYDYINITPVYQERPESLMIVLRFYNYLLIKTVTFVVE